MGASEFEAIKKSGESEPIGFIDIPAGTATVPGMRILAGAVLTTPAGNVIEWDGSALYITTAAGARKTIAYVTDIHAAITLAASADVLLGLSGQELSLDNQDANKVLAGPASGAAAAPTFRVLVTADLPAVLKGQHQAADATPGITGTQVIVTGVSQDPVTKDIAVTTKTITYKDGLITDIS